MELFDYHKPVSLEEACSLLVQFGQEARILAGGTDLILQLKKQALNPKHVINIKSLKELNFIRQEEDGFVLGALASLADIVEHPGLQKIFACLVDSAKSIGSTQVRNVATLGGNLCNASPAADMAPGLLVLDASVKIAGPRGSRCLPLEKFFLGPAEVDLRAAEILTEIRVPVPPKGTRMIFVKHGPRKAMDISVVSVAVAVTWDKEKGHCDRARVALGAVAPIPVRIRPAEGLIEGSRQDEISPSKVAEAVRRAIRPISDVRASAEYRVQVAGALTERAVRHAIHMA